MAQTGGTQPNFPRMLNPNNPYGYNYPRRKMLYTPNKPKKEEREKGVLDARAKKGRSRDRKGNRC